MRELPHLTYLLAFEAAARHLSFTRAADELNCTQAAISQRIRALEQYFSRPLFHRRPNGLELSSVGKAYLPGIAEALDRAEAATRGLTGGRGPKVVTVSAPITFLTHWLSHRLNGFLKAHPDTSLRLNSAIWTDPNIELADLSVSVIELGRLPPNTQLLAHENLVLVTRSQLGLARSTADYLNGIRHVDVEGKHRLWDRWARAAKIVLEPRLPVIRVDNAATALEIVADGNAATVVHSTYVADMLKSRRLASPFGKGVDAGFGLVLSTNPNRSISTQALQFKAWLMSQFLVCRAVPDRRAIKASRQRSRPP